MVMVRSTHLITVRQYVQIYADIILYLHIFYCYNNNNGEEKINKEEKEKKFSINKLMINYCDSQPIVKDFARLQNLISQCQNLSGIGLELVFFGRNLFFLEMVFLDVLCYFIYYLDEIMYHIFKEL
ncbi:hypothetical protein RhiirA1_446340 [Rhizophagus irregularis]|uniref:Uncharacterized protein n=1 Tax=Rhizophagus irregularis TaxID=588596 RepID=A0A2N0R145_9GLOM|nr:hypothetical protein RhiirA1_446340 [Rhizophagus irregularis]